MSELQTVRLSVPLESWLATVPGEGYFVILRLYGPTEAAIDKNWKPSDVEEVK